MNCKLSRTGSDRQRQLRFAPVQSKHRSCKQGDSWTCSLFVWRLGCDGSITGFADAGGPDVASVQARPRVMGKRKKPDVVVIDDSEEDQPASRPVLSFKARPPTSKPQAGLRTASDVH